MMDPAFAFTASGDAERTMRMCEKHFEALRVALTAVGLGPHMAQDAYDEGRRTMLRLAGDTSVRSFDAMLHTSHMIYHMAAHQIHTGQLDDFSGCPICKVMEACPCGRPECTPAAREEHWIEGPVQRTIEHARRLRIPLK